MHHRHHLFHFGADAANRHRAAEGPGPAAEIRDHRDGIGGHAANIFQIEQNSQIGPIQVIGQLLLDVLDFRLLDQHGVVDADGRDALLLADAQPAHHLALHRVHMLDDLGGGVGGIGLFVKEVRFVENIAFFFNVEATRRPFFEIAARERLFVELNHEMQAADIEPIAGMQRPFLARRQEVIVDQGRLAAVEIADEDLLLAADQGDIASAAGSGEADRCGPIPT